MPNHRLLVQLHDLCTHKLLGIQDLGYMNSCPMLVVAAKTRLVWLEIGGQLERKLCFSILPIEIIVTSSHGRLLFENIFPHATGSPSGKQLHAWHLYFLTSNRNTFNKSGRHFGSTMDLGYGHWSQASIKKLKSTIYFVNLHRHTICTPHAFHYTWRHTTNTIIISLITFANPQTIVL